MNKHQKLGSFITSLRRQRGMTQGDLASALKTSQSAIARIEKGEQNMSIDMLSKIATVLDRPLLSLSKEKVNFKINGGKKLKGSIRANVSKNAVMGLMAASLLNKSTTTLKSIPKIEEVFRLIEVMKSIGVDVKWINDEKDLSITPPKKLKLSKLNKDAAKRTRSIIMFLGPLMHLEKEFKLPYSGGCKLGTRTVRPHLYGLEKLGLEIDTKDDWYEVSVKDKGPNEVILYEAGDTVTENVLMAAARMEGVTTIKFASANYMVQEVCFFLEALGVKIEGIGTSTLIVHGKPEINEPITYAPSEDPIEVMFFLAAAILTKSSIRIERCPIDFLELELLKLEKMGFKYKLSKKYKAYNGKTDLVDIRTYASNLVALKDKVTAGPYPAINIDNLPFFVIIAAAADGRTLIHDWVYENRAIYYTEISKLGADVQLADPHRAYITGPTKFRATDLMCPPALRPSAIILIGMLAAKGTSILRDVYSIQRGYEDLANRLNTLGADIKMMMEW